MRITSGILGSLGAAVKRGLVGVYETDIVVPPVIQGTMEIREVLRSLYAQGLTVGIQTTSFALDFGIAITNGVANNSFLFGLDPGAWELDLSVSYSANYVSNQAFALVTSFPTSAPFNILNIGNVVTAGTTIALVKKLKLNIDQVLSFTFVLNANGAAQTHQALLSVLAHKLL